MTGLSYLTSFLENRPLGCNARLQAASEGAAGGAEVLHVHGVPGDVRGLLEVVDVAVGP